MRRLSHNDRTNRNRIQNIRALFRAVFKAISADELEQNDRIKAEIKSIRKQLRLISTLNRSFES